MNFVFQPWQLLFLILAIRMERRTAPGGCVVSKTMPSIEAHPREPRPFVGAEISLVAWRSDAADYLFLTPVNPVCAGTFSDGTLRSRFRLLPLNLPCDLTAHRAQCAHG
jgi:hypothetical protein